MDYNKYLESNDWRKLRNLKTNTFCAICASSGQLDTHHLNYKNLSDVDTSDLRRLCRRCHFLTHKLFREGKIVFRSTNHHSRFAIIKSAAKKELGLSTINLFALAEQG